MEDKRRQHHSQSLSPNNDLSVFLRGLNFASRRDRQVIEQLITIAFVQQPPSELDQFIAELRRLSLPEVHQVFTAIGELAQENLCTALLYQSLVSAPQQALVMALCFRYMAQRNELTSEAINALKSRSHEAPVLLQHFVQGGVSTSPVR